MWIPRKDYEALVRGVDDKANKAILEALEGVSKALKGLASEEDVTRCVREVQSLRTYLARHISTIADQDEEADEDVELVPTPGGWGAKK